MKILEEFNGFLDQIRDGIAHFTLKKGDETFWCECEADKLTKHGVKESRRFICRTIEIGDEVDIQIEAIPDKELTPEDYARIDAQLKDIGDE